MRIAANIWLYICIMVTCAVFQGEAYASSPSDQLDSPLKRHCALEADRMFPTRWEDEEGKYYRTFPERPEVH